MHPTVMFEELHLIGKTSQQYTTDKTAMGGRAHSSIMQVHNVHSCIYMT